jgi:hypothetical protein
MTVAGKRVVSGMDASHLIGIFLVVQEEAEFLLLLLLLLLESHSQAHCLSLA